MNDKRRKQIEDIANQLIICEVEVKECMQTICDKCAVWRANAEVANEQLEQIRDDEQEYFDIMPLQFQTEYRVQKVEEAIENLEIAIDTMNTFMDTITELQEHLELSKEVMRKKRQKK